MDLHVRSCMWPHGAVLNYTQGQFVLFGVICYCRFRTVIVNLMLEVIQKNTLACFVLQW